MCVFQCSRALVQNGDYLYNKLLKTCIYTIIIEYPDDINKHNLTQGSQVSCISTSLHATSCISHAEK